MAHDPQDPAVKEAFQNLITQTTAQYEALVKAGYKFYFIDPKNDPYKSPWDAMRELRADKTMGVFPTFAGFGASNADVSGNPLNVDTGIKWGGEPVMANDLFRAVHDAFGHGLEGAGFRARGEENAWQSHIRLFTGSAIGAITSETRGQNSWLNYGPNAEKNQTAKVEDTVFADQKTGLMPEWTWTEGIKRTPARESAQDLIDKSDIPSADKIRLAADLRRGDVTEADVAKVLGKPAEIKRSTPRLAPNGKPSNLDDRQWAQVRTPEFKAWFGDWEKGNIWGRDDVSKIVDANGEPLVVYHGAKQGGFTVMRPDKGDKHRSPMTFAASTHETARSYSGKGVEVQFDLDPALLDDAADAYQGVPFAELTQDDQRYIEQELLGEYARPGVYSLFLNIRNPNEIDMQGGNWDGSHRGQYRVLFGEESSGEPGEPIYNKAGREWMSEDEAITLSEETPDTTVEEGDDFGFETTNSAAEDALRYKQDGAIIRNVVDDGGQTGSVDAADVFVFFDSNQAKSATSNIGTFDAKDPDIRRSPPRPADGDLSKRLLADMPEQIGVNISLEVYAENEVELANIEAVQKNQGAGTKAMQSLIEAADKNGINLMLIPAGDDAKKQRLTVFYGRFGFESDGDVMRRRAAPDIRRTPPRGADAYQGHLPDGSSVQAHSAGGLYPFVLYAQGTPGDLTWGYIAPGKEGQLIGNYDDANDKALEAKNEWDAGIRRSPPRLYSALNRMFEGTPERVFNQPATMLGAWLKGNAQKNAVKTDEIYWSGIENYLTLQGKNKVSKADVLAYLAENNVQTVNVVLGGGPTTGEQRTIWREVSAIVSENDNLGYDRVSDAVSDILNGSLAPQQMDIPDAQREQLQNAVARYAKGGEVKHAGGNLVLPGGTNQRETVVTIPSIKAWGETDVTHYGDTGKGKQIAWVRTNDRTDADGAEGRFIEEEQSRRAMEGKSKGFASTEPLFELRNRAGNLESVHGSKDDAEAAKVRMQKRFPHRPAESVTAGWTITQITSPVGPPPAPFITTADNKASTAYITLLMKKAVLQAIDDGKSWVAWTTAAQQSERYSLDKTVQSIEWSGGYKPDTRRVEIYTIEGDAITLATAAGAITESSQDGLVGKDLSELVGKEIAAQIRKEGAGELSGEGLKIDPAWTKGMYGDERGLDAKGNPSLMSLAAMDVLKKLGGGKVESINVNTGETGATRLSELERQRLDKLTATHPDRLSEAERAEVRDLMVKHNADTMTSQPGFYITPEMVAKAEGGLPLFTKPRAQGFVLPEETKLRAAQRTIQDHQVRWDVVQDAIKAQGGSVTEANNVFLALKVYPGRVAAAFRAFQDQTLEPILERAAKAGIRLEDVAAYMYARHAPERNAQIAKINLSMPDGGSGMTNADAATIVAQYKGNKVLIGIADDLQTITSNTMQILVNFGVFSQEHADTYANTYQYYVPLKGFEQLDEDGKLTGTGMGHSTPAKIGKRALGRKSRAGQIIENIVRDHEAAILAAEKINVGRVVRAFVEANPDGNLWSVEKAPYTPMFVKGSKAHPEGMVALRKNMFDPEKELRYIEGDTEIRIQLHDPLLLRAYNKLGFSQMGQLFELSASFNSYLRQMYIEKNPSFFFVNPLRDLQDIGITLTGMAGAKVSANAFRHWPGAWLSMIRYAEQTKSTSTFVGRHTVGSDTKAWKQWIKDFTSNGGGIGFSFVGDIRHKAEQIQNLMTRLGGDTVFQAIGRGDIKAGAKLLLFRTINNELFDMIQHLNYAFENASRLATFRALVEDGTSKREAARMSKMVTTNFNDKGEIGGEFTALFLFGNAAIQGAAKNANVLFGKLGKHKGQLYSIVATIMALGFLEGLSYGDDDDEDLVAESEKRRSWGIDLGDGTRLTPPKPYGWSFFYDLGRSAARVTKGSSLAKESLAVAGSFLGNFSPINPIPDDKLNIKDVAQAITPTVLRPIVQIATNRSAFGSPIMPEGKESQPDSMKMWRKTRGTAYEALAKGMNVASGGDEVQAGVVDVSPETLKLMVNFLTGGAGRFVTDTASTGYELATDGKAKLENAPVARTFYKKVGIDAHRARFYDQADEVRRLQEYKAGYKKLKSDEGDAGQDKIDENELVYLKPKNTSKRLTTLRDEVEEVTLDKTITQAQKRKQVQALEKEQINEVQNFDIEFKAARRVNSVNEQAGLSEAAKQTRIALINAAANASLKVLNDAYAAEALAD